MFAIIIETAWQGSIRCKYRPDTKEPTKTYDRTCNKQSNRKLEKPAEQECESRTKFEQPKKNINNMNNSESGTFHCQRFCYCKLFSL